MNSRTPVYALFLVLSALLLETAGAAPLFLAHIGIPFPLFFYVGLHLAAAVMVARGLWHAFPAAYRQPPSGTLATLFIIASLTPLLGIPGMIAGLLIGLYAPKKRKSSMYHSIDIPELPYKPLHVSAQPLFGKSGLAGVIENAPDPDKRVRAVMATRQLRDKDAIPILRLALRDPVDDVRLLAYSLLDGKEQKINSRIKELASQLDRSEGIIAGKLHERLAAEYWELAYLGLATGDVRQHVLEEALRQISAAENLLPKEVGLLFQKGRILLNLNRLEEAEEALQEARKLGMSEMDVNPYLAEAAYLKRDWEGVSRLMSALDSLGRSEPPISFVADYWAPRP